LPDDLASLIYALLLVGVNGMIAWKRAAKK
jgi:hypothetical protein